jgi:hypothetical protein
MAWSPTQSGVLNPANIFTTSVADSTGILLDYDDLESYKVSTSGDVRELVYSVLDKVEDYFNNDVSAGNKPSKFLISKNYSSNGEDSAKKVFTVTFLLDAANVTYDVSEE